MSPWEDVGEGVCGRCQIKRRLYSPCEDLKVKRCAACAQAWENDRLPNYGRGTTSLDDDDVIEEDDT